MLTHFENKNIQGLVVILLYAMLVNDCLAQWDPMHPKIT